MPAQDYADTCGDDKQGGRARRLKAGVGAVFIPGGSFLGVSVEVVGLGEMFS